MSDRQDQQLDRLLRAMPAPSAADTARLRGNLAAAIARRPLPRPEPFWRRVAPVGCGALAMALCCAFWLAMPPAQASSDYLTGLAALPFAEDIL